MLVLGLFITKVLLVTYIRKFANIYLYFCRKQKAHLEVADTLSGWYSREKWNFLGVVFSYTIIQYDINTIIAACSLTWRGRLFSPIGRLLVFVRLEKFHFSPRTTQTLLATFVRSSRESSDFLSGLSVSVPERVGLPSPSMPPHAVREKSGTFVQLHS